MSCVLYYSKYCENCRKLLYELGKSEIQNSIHFLCIDKRAILYLLSQGAAWN